MGIEINPMWDFLLKNKVMALVNMNNEEEAVALQQVRIEKAGNDSSLKRSRYGELSRLYWTFNNMNAAKEAAKSRVIWH